MSSETDFSRFAIKQLNFGDASALNSGDYKQILQLQSLAFSGNCPDNLFQRFMKEILNARSLRSQLLYLVDTQSGIVVSSYEILIKETDLSNVINLVVSAVCTHPDYRKKGLMEYLISETMKKYENPLYEFSGSGEHDEDAINEYVNSELNIKKASYFWTLYSAVKEYYSRFGFKGVRNINWLTSPKIELTSVPEEFDLLGNESFLSRDEVLFKLSNPKYLPNLSTNDSQRSVSLTAPTFHEFFVDRDIFLLNHYGKKADIFGLSILTDDNEGETFVVIASDVHMENSLIGRLFTTIQDKKLLTDHINRIIKFSEWHEKNYHSSLPFAINDQFTGNVKITTNDIFTTDSNESITDLDTKVKDFIIDYLKQNYNWSYDDSNNDTLAMLKEFGRDGYGDEIEWNHNGMWCFD